MASAIENILRELGRCRVLVIGDLMLDHYISGDANRISPEAPVPVVQVDEDNWAAGGAANVALNVSALGAKASLLGALGDDEAGKRLSMLVQLAGVEIDQRSFGETPTIVKTRVVVRNQQLCRLDRELAPARYRLPSFPDDAGLAELLEQHDCVIFSDYAKGIVTSELLERCERLARDHNCLLAMDPKPRSGITYTNVDLMTPNRSESLELAGMKLTHHDRFPAEEVCERIYARYRPKHLVITLGAEGMLLSREGRVREHIPTRAREVFDVSGAGDTVIAALGTALAAGCDLRAAADFANHAAGVVVAKFGTATAGPDEILAHASVSP